MKHFPLILAALAVAACGAETEFRNTDQGGEYEEGNGRIEVTPAELRFTDLDPVVARGLDLEVASVGDTNLTIFEVRILDSGDGAFYMDREDDVVLAPGTTRLFHVVASLAEGVTSAEGSLRIKCNDADNLTLEIPLYASLAGGDDTGGDTGTEPGDDTGGGPR